MWDMVLCFISIYIWEDMCYIIIFYLGPTSCGKSSLVKTKLEFNSSLILPKLHRIIWLYKRWQPLHVEIQKNVIPRVEFIQG